MKKTKFLTSVAALALVLGLGACAEAEEENLRGTEETWQDKDEEVIVYETPTDLIQGIADTKNYTMDFAYIENRSSNLKADPAEASDEDLEEWYQSLAYRSGYKWHEEVSEHVYYGARSSRYYGATGILKWDEDSEAWVFDAYDYEWKVDYQILAVDSVAYRQNLEAEDVVRVFIWEEYSMYDDDWNLITWDEWDFYCLWDVAGAGGFAGLVHDVLDKIPVTEGMSPLSKLPEVLPTILDDISQVEGDHYTISDENGAATGLVELAATRLGISDYVEEYGIELKDSVYDAETGVWDLDYECDPYYTCTTLFNSTTAYLYTEEMTISISNVGTTVPPYDWDNLPEIVTWYGYYDYYY